MPDEHLDRRARHDEVPGPRNEYQFAVRSCFPELILDLESRIDEDIQFVQTTVIATIDTALAEFSSLQSEPEEENKVETGDVDPNLLYEPTADELNCEEEMQARAATTIGHVRARASCLPSHFATTSVVSQVTFDVNSS